MAILRQLLAGIDFALADPAAARMGNCAYLIADERSGRGVLVDPAWDVPGLLAIAAAEGVSVVAAVATHRHSDHVGGNLFGTPVSGVAELLSALEIPLYVHALDADVVRRRVPEAARERVRAVEDGHRIELGDVALELLHTPGHTLGSQCVLVEGRLLTGDTLFVGTCGRVDLEGSDPLRMWQSLQRLAALPDDTVVLPGHGGLTASSTIGDEKRDNPCLQARSVSAWRGFLRGLAG